jgi:hypothetical protein
MTPKEPFWSVEKTCENEIEKEEEVLDLRVLNFTCAQVTV